MHYFHLVLEHGLPPSLILNHSAYSILPRTQVVCGSMARGTKVHFNFARAQALAKRLQHFIKHHTTFVAHCCMLINRVQISYNTTQHFFRNILNTLNSPPPSQSNSSTSDSSPESILKDCKTSKRAHIQNSHKGQPKTKISRTQLMKFAKKISLGLVNKGMWRENCFYCPRASTTE